MDGTYKDDNGNGYSVKGIDEMLRKLRNFNFTRTEKSHVVEAGVPVISESIRKHAPYHTHYPSQDYLSGKKRKPTHLRDENAVTHKPNQYADGSTNVGYSAQNAVVARFVDHGTFKLTGNNFMEHAYQNTDYDKLFGREREVAKQIMKKKGFSSDND